MFNLKRDILEDLSKEELIDLIDKYDSYIIEFCKDNAGYKLEDDVVPSCVGEFYDNDYLNGVGI